MPSARQLILQWISPCVCICMCVCPCHHVHMGPTYMMITVGQFSIAMEWWQRAAACIARKRKEQKIQTPSLYLYICKQDFPSLISLSKNVTPLHRGNRSHDTMYLGQLAHHPVQSLRHLRSISSNTSTWSSPLCPQQTHPLVLPMHARGPSLCICITKYTHYHCKFT